VSGLAGESAASDQRGTKGLRLSAAWTWWGALSPIAQLAVWLALFLLASRLLYLPWSQMVAGSEHGELTAPRDTALVLEGGGQDGASAVTLLFEDFESVTLESERAGIAPASRPLLQEMGAVLPPPERLPATLSWNVNIRAQPGERAAAGLLRIELSAEEGADLTLGGRGGTLRLSSPRPFALSPVAQDYTTIGGWLLLGGEPTGAPPDASPTFVIARGGDGGAAQAAIAYRSADPELVLGDPFAAESSVSVRSVALLDESGGLVRRICGAPSGRMMLLPALFQPRLEPQPPAERCRPGYLTASAARLKDGSVAVSLSGSGFVAGTADWLDKLKGNIVLWPVILALIAIPGQRLLKLAPALLARKAA